MYLFLVCPAECNHHCTADGRCCHEQCLGGCVGPNHDQCFACKFYKDSPYDCVKACPPNTLIVCYTIINLLNVTKILAQKFCLQFKERRCISENDCYHMPKHRDPQSGLHLQSWKPFNNKSCVLECPHGFEEVSNINEKQEKVFNCQKCAGKVYVVE